MPHRNALYAPYDPSPTQRPAGGSALVVRGVTAEDAPVIAALWAERHGADAAEGEPGVRRHLAAIADGRARDQVFLAEVGGQPAGYGKCGWRDYSGGGAVDGWYLLGVVVHPDFWRRGAASALARRRFRWLRDQGAEAVWSFSNSRNPASLDMHRKHGFAEVTRDFTIPNISFSGGEGVLMRRGLAD